MREMLLHSPVAYVPFGALEWHGEHGPLGLDGLKARAICERAAAVTGGVVFPPVFWGAFDTMPFPFTFNFSRSDLKRLVRKILRQLEQWGFEVIVLLTGHYPPSQVSLLKKECRRFNKKSKALAMGAPEQVFAVDMGYYGDHAGMWETSIMLALRPGLVDMGAMPPGLPLMERVEKYGVMGQDPMEKASAEKGEEVIRHIVEGMAAMVARAREEKSDAVFEEIYRAHEKAISVFSVRAPRLARDALGVKSLGDLIRLGLWTIRNM